MKQNDIFRKFAILVLSILSKSRTFISFTYLFGRVPNAMTFSRRSDNDKPILNSAFEISSTMRGFLLFLFLRNSNAENYTEEIEGDIEDSEFDDIAQIPK